MHICNDPCIQGLCTGVLDIPSIRSRIYKKLVKLPKTDAMLTYLIFNSISHLPYVTHQNQCSAKLSLGSQILCQLKINFKQL